MEPQGKLTFFCPKCQQKLSFLEGTVIKMIGRLHAPTFSCQTYIYVPAKLGQHGAIIGEGVSLEEGAMVELECINAACAHNFTTPYNAELAEIAMVDAGETPFKVVFNKVWGKHTTFVLDMRSKTVIQHFGEDAEGFFASEEERGRNFFGH